MVSVLADPAWFVVEEVDRGTRSYDLLGGNSWLGFSGATSGMIWTHELFLAFSSLSI